MYGKVLSSMLVWVPSAVSKLELMKKFVYNSFSFTNRTKKICSASNRVCYHYKSLLARANYVDDLILFKLLEHRLLQYKKFDPLVNILTWSTFRLVKRLTPFSENNYVDKISKWFLERSLNRCANFDDLDAPLLNNDVWGILFIQMQYVATIVPPKLNTRNHKYFF